MGIQSTLGKGTTVTISLPLEFLDSPTPVPLATPPIDSATRLPRIQTDSPPRQHKRRVLSEELSTLFKSLERPPDSPLPFGPPPPLRRGSSHRDKAVLGTQLDGADLHEELERFRIASPRPAPKPSPSPVPDGSGLPVSQPSLAPRVNVLIAEDNHIAR